MAALALRVRAWLRRQRLRAVATILLVAVTGGLTMGLAAGTRRTQTAPDRYTAKAGGDPDLVITQQRGLPLTDAVSRLPGVVSTQGQTFVPSFLVSPLDGTPLLDNNTFAGDDRFVGTRIAEGRFTDPAHPDEFTINGAMASFLARRFGTRVGDRFQVVSYDQDQVAAGFTSLDRPAVPPFTATLVGITGSPAEFDDKYPAMVFARSFLEAHPDIAVVQTQIAVHLGGTRPADVMDAVRRMPDGNDADAVPKSVVSEGARRAVRFQVTALWLVTALSAVAAALLMIQVLSRALSIGDDERRSMRALGYGPGGFAMEGLAEAGIVAVIAAPIALAIAYALTSRFPLGVLRTFEPAPGPRVEWLVNALGTTLVAGIVLVTGAIVATRRRADPVSREVGRIGSWMSRRNAGMPLRVGARFTLSSASGRGTWPSLLPGALGVTGLVASMIVGLTLVQVVGTPGRWGVTYDRQFGNPYTEADSDIVTPVAENRDVVAATGANIGTTTINGSETATIAFDNVKGRLLPRVVRGRPPANGEIGLGAEVAHRLHVGIGDRVEVAGTSGKTRKLAVVGVVVTPDSAGNGAALTFETYLDLHPTATKNVLFVDFRDGAPRGLVEAIAADNYTPPGVIASVLPPSVRALERVTAAPFLLAAVLAFMLVTGSAYVFASSFRRRRRDLAILRALGSDSRQMRAVVHWQSTLAAAIIVTPGVAVGILVGGRVVAFLLDAVGLVPGADVRPLGIAALVGGALLVANTLALPAARRAARVRMTDLSLDR